MIRRFRRFISGAMVFLMVHASAFAAATDLATSPLVTTPSASIQPNLLFAFDDSGSMAWFHLPDDSADPGSSVPWQYGWFGARSSQCNGMYYNPAIVYKAPVDSTGANYPNSNFTAAWNDGHAAAYFTTPFSTTSGVTNLTTGFKGISGDSAITADATAGNAYYYLYLGAQTQAQKNYNSTTSTFFTECSSNRGLSAAPATIPTGTLAAGGTNGIWIKANVGATTTTTQAISSYTRSATSGSCTITVTVPSGMTTGLAAGKQVTIAGLNNTNLNGTFAVLAGGLTTTTFTYTAAECGPSTTLPTGYTTGGTFTWTVFNTDERNNFANWYSFYRSRILMMKTAMGLALQPIGNQYRVGFLPMNQAAEVVPIATFNAAQKATFYTNLYQKTVGGSTPSLTTVSNAGKYFANKLTSYGGVSLPDPMQYSCQQNFTIFSTDGFWNSGSATKLDGTAIGNADGAEPRPFNDGSNSVVTAVTPSVVTVRQSVAQNQTIKTPWVKNTTSVSATKNCTAIPASSGRSSPPNTCLQDGATGPNSINQQRTWCVGPDPNPGNSRDCTGPYGTGATQVYSCRGISAAGNVPDAPDNVGCQYDGNNQLYCLFQTTSGSNGCTPVYTGSPIRICRAAAAAVPNSGYTVTTTPATYQQTQTGTKTTIQDVATTTNTTVVTTNGVSAPPTTSSGGSTTTVVGTPTTTIATDTGAPTGGTTFTNGTATTSCVITPPITPGTSAVTGPTAGSPTITNNGTATTTTVSTSAPVIGTTTTTASTSGGTSNTLADVAEYYYTTDLRTSLLGNCTGSPVPPATTGLDVCTNNVPVSGQDAASWQHMTFFGLTLGARGQMLYSPTYLTDKTGDYFSVLQGQTANTAGGICSWQANGTTCNWPVPGIDSGGNGFLGNVDDTWHASVNGRGQYFSATDPGTLTLGLQTALAGVKTRTGASAAATTSNPNVTSGDNFVFSSTFTTTQWDGQLQRQQLDLNTGAVSSTVDWTAQGQLDSNASRVAWTFDPTNTTTGLKSFAYSSLSSSEQTWFNSANIASLSQFCASGATCLSAADQTSAAGAPLVSYLAGDRTHEGVLSDPTAWYRQRIHVLGDIVDAEAVYVKAPLLNYSDAGFSTYASTTGATRQGMVYVAANDGMLHAFNSSTGAEAWTFVPTLVFPNLYKLADKNYGTSAAQPHQYYTDGTPIAGDVYFGGAWHTIVVAGLSGGGQGYYALDVTDPTNPKALWQFTDTNMGFTYGNPVISKLKDCVPATPATCTNGSGTWVVFLTSGYNNNASGQDGQGHLYVVNAGTGALIRDISTGVGSTTTPSGLARINAWVDNTAVDNTALRVYGGDLLGNMWRFDVNNLYGTAGYDAQKLITVYANAAGTVPQPITVKPELGLVNTTVPVVYFGTGRFLGLTDLADTTQQTFYAVQDKLNATTLVTPRSTSPASGFVAQTLTITTCPANSPATICSTGQIVRTSTSNPVSFPTNNGWYIDLPDAGERDNTDPTLALGTLGFTTNVPATSACTAGGTSFRYLLDYATGAPVSTSTTHVSAIQLGSALATRAVFVRLPNNTVVQLTRMSDGTTLTTNVPIGGGASNLRRVSWRELITDQ